jgi:hypothetical protein
MNHTFIEPYIYQREFFRMNHEHTFDELKAVAEQIGVTVRAEKGNFGGGFCVLRDKKLIVINKTVPLESRVATLAQALSYFPLETVSIKPALRLLIDKQSGKSATN